MKLNKKFGLYFLYIIISILVFTTGSLIFIAWYKNQTLFGFDKKTYEETITKIENIKFEKEELISNDIFSNNNIVEIFTGSEYVDLYSGYVNENNLDVLKEYYRNAFVKGDENQQLIVLEQIYKKTLNKDYLQLIIQKSKNLYQFDKSFAYLQDIVDDKYNLNGFPVEDFFYIMINHLDLNSENLKKIKSILKHYFSSQIIDQNDFNYYSSLLYLIAYDLENFFVYFEQIGESKYKKFQDNIIEATQTFNSYSDVPNYYQKALYSLVLFQNGYIKPAEKLSLDVVKENSKFILPNQILAYSYFLKNDYQQARKFFVQLIEIDPVNSNSYRFYLGLSHFWRQRYEDSIVFLSQIFDGDLKKDALRYLILGYYNISDNINLISTLYELIDNHTLNEYDYYTFFDIFFYKPLEKTNIFTLFQNNSSLALKYIQSCSKNLTSKNNYVCIYGKAGFLLAKGETNKSLKYLNYIAKYYPRNYVFENIAKIYESNGDIINAKKYYLNAILSSNDNDSKLYYKNMLINAAIGN